MNSDTDDVSSDPESREEHRPSSAHGRLDTLLESPAEAGEINGTIEDDIFDKSHDYEALSSEYKYGWFSWHPDCLQTLNKPRWLLAFLCFFSFIQGLVVNGFINVVITTLERRFNLPSKQTGLIASTYDISSALLVVFVSYYGGRGHKAKWLAFGCVIMAVGSLVFALPHFATGIYSSKSDSLVCRVDSPDDECRPITESESSGLSKYLFVFIVSQVLHGLGCTPLYSIGVTLLDESVNVHQSALYLGIFYTIAALGPSCGYIAGGAMLNIYTDVGQVDLDSLNLTPSDPSWVGAWWVGFLMCGAIAFFVAVPISGYPKELPSTAKIRARKTSQAHVSRGVYDTTRTGFGTKFSDFPRTLKCLFMNAPFVCLVIAASCKGAVVAGFSTFAPKAIETQFSKTAGEASLLLGVCAVPGALLGTLIGAYIVKRWKLKVRGMLRLSCFSTFMALIAFAGIIKSCPEEYMVGVNTDYFGNITVSSTTQLLNDCNAGCGCTMNEFNPVCGDNGLEYFDPCFAGCTEQSENSETYDGCSCLSLSGSNTTLTVTGGKCTKECHYLPFYLLSLFMSMMFSFMAGIPIVSAMLRCVPESQRSLAMGVQWVFVRAIGTIPAPIVYGTVLDGSCILWQQNCKGDYGSCFLYSATTVSMKLFLLGFCSATLGLIFLITALGLYKSPEDVMDKTGNKNGGNFFSKKIGFNSKPSVNRQLSTSSQLGIVTNEKNSDNM